MIVNQITVGPVEEPINISQAKQHLRVDDSSEDSLISALIQTSRQMVENYTGRVVLRQTRDLIFDKFEEPMRLGAPLSSVTSISYVDVNGATQTLAGSEYVVIAPTAQPEPVGFVQLAYGKSWPSVRSVYNAVTIRAVLGYATPDAVPASLRSAMLLLIGDLYENREAQSDAVLQDNKTVQRLLFPWVVTWF